MCTQVLISSHCLTSQMKGLIYNLFHKTSSSESVFLATTFGWIHKQNSGANCLLKFPPSYSMFVSYFGQQGPDIFCSPRILWPERNSSQREDPFGEKALASLFCFRQLVDVFVCSVCVVFCFASFAGRQLRHKFDHCSLPPHPNITSLQ